MTLPFATQIAGNPTHFVNKILSSLNRRFVYKVTLDGFLEEKYDEKPFDWPPNQKMRYRQKVFAAH